MTLKDHETQIQFTVQCTALADIPETLEAVLGSGKVPWRQFKSYKLTNKIKVPKNKDD